MTTPTQMPLRTASVVAAPWRPYDLLKRLLDVLVSGLGLALASPLFLLFSLAIILEDGFPIFYTQVRVGRLGPPPRL